MWKDKIKEGSFTSSTGQRVEFEYEEVDRDITKKGTRFEFRNVNNSYAQDSGITSRSFPLTIYISGPDYDLKCDVFDSAILTKGVGRLEIGFYSVDAVVLGKVSRKDRFVDGAGQAVYTLEFIESIKSLYPTENVDILEDVKAKGAESEQKIKEQFEQNIKVDNTVEEETLYLRYKEYLDQVNDSFRSLSNGMSETRALFDQYYEIANASINTFLGNPAKFFFNLNLLIKTPSQMGNDLGNKIDGYLNFFRSTSNDVDQNVNDPTLPADAQNNLALGDGMLGTVIASLANLSTTATFESRSNAKELSDAIAQVSESYVEIRDQWYSKAEVLDTGESQQIISSTGSGAQKLLNNSLFDLPVERNITLTYPRTILDLAYQYYRNVSQETVQYIIDTNRLRGDEILLLPVGKTVTFYI